MRGWCRWSVRIVLSLSLISAPNAVDAQPATPDLNVDIPLAEECQIAPRNAMELLALAGGADSSTPAAIPTPLPKDRLPVGPPPDADEVEEVDRTVRELVACANARDPFRAVALVSDSYLNELAGLVGSALGGGANQLATALPVPLDLPADQQVGFNPPSELRLLPDGRIGGIVEPVLVGVNLPSIDLYLIFEREGDRWLIDAVLPLAPADSTATPAS